MLIFDDDDFAQVSLASSQPERLGTTIIIGLNPHDVIEHLKIIKPGVTKFCTLVTDLGPLLSTLGRCVADCI